MPLKLRPYGAIEIRLLLLLLLYNAIFPGPYSIDTEKAWSEDVTAFTDRYSSVVNVTLLCSHSCEVL